MSVGPMEIIIVLALALLIFGPKRLPEMGRTLGRAAREFRRASDEVKGVLNLDLSDDEGQKAGAGADLAVTAATPSTSGDVPWSREDTAGLNDDARAANGPGAEALPGLAGFLGVAPAGIEPPASVTGVGEPAATAFASFLGASATKTDAEAEAPAVAETCAEAEAPAVAAADDPALTVAAAVAEAGEVPRPEAPAAAETG